MPPETIEITSERESGSGGAIGACTIISKNYLSLARVWSKSVRRHHPEIRTFVLLVDRIEGMFDPADEPFETIEVERLGIPNFNGMAFKYSILELNTAVKPFLLEFLLTQRGLSRLLYFDPDTMLYAPARRVLEDLEDNDLVLTPHILSPLPNDGKRPNEMDFLISGSYNLGFIGVRNGPDALEFLRWWQSRLTESGFSAPEQGLFTDQKWVDLAPSLVPRVHILRDRGHNAAYWNLHERLDLTARGGTYAFPECPLIFFHFSGLDFSRPERISKYQNRFRLRNLPQAYRSLFSEYIARVRENGFFETRHWRYAFGWFDDGVPIPNILRAVYARCAVGEPSNWPDPFRTAEPETFRAWLLEEPAFGVRVPRILAEIYSLRPDVQAAIPDGTGTGAPALLRWAIGIMAKEYGVGSYFVDDFSGRLRCLEEEAKALEAAKVPPVPRPDYRFLHRILGNGAAERLEDIAWMSRQIDERLRESGDFFGDPENRWKQRLEKLMGPQRYRKARTIAWKARLLARRTAARRSGAAPEQTDPEGAQIRPIDPALPLGVNLFGYLDTESGVGEIARALAQMLRRLEVPHALLNIEQAWLRRRDRRIQGFSSKNPYALNLIAVNADQLPGLIARLGPDPFQGRRNVGYWFWELSNFPEADRPAFRHVDEVWVASDFCLDAISRNAPVPVVKVAPGFDFRDLVGRTKPPVGPHAGTFTFLYVFDGASSIHRKNPVGLVNAFRRAFPAAGHERLILKTINASGRRVEALWRIAGESRIEILDDYMNRNELIELLDSADCYVSLHRSEGFGLTILEAMALGKPVIATAYSGCTEFLHTGNGFPVGYRLVPIRRHFGPYSKGNEWAEPCVEEAARWMQEVRNSPATAAERAERARSEVAERWSVEAGARRLASHLQRLIPEFAELCGAARARDAAD